jgi:two-component system, OmpR family, response regulator RegX3
MMLTAIDDEPSVVQALEAGADDYIVKPCPRSVLRARVEALLRRLRPESATLSQRIEADPYALDFAQRSVTLHAQVVSLTRREFDLAWVLFCNPSRLFTRRELLDAVWGRDCNFESHNVAQHVSAIRRKLDLARHGFRLLATHSIGYRLEWPESVSPQPER